MSIMWDFRHRQQYSVPLRIEFLNIVISKSNSEQVGVVLDRIVGSSDPEFVRRSSRQSVYLEGNGPLSGPFVPPDWFSFWNGNYGWSCSGLKQFLASSTSKFGIEIPRIDDEDLKSSTESTNSTSLIHCMASVGKCEQVQTSVLNLIFQQANVAGVGNLSKWRSEICSRCWSAP